VFLPYTYLEKYFGIRDSNFMCLNITKIVGLYNNILLKHNLFDIQIQNNVVIKCLKNYKIG